MKASPIEGTWLLENLRQRQPSPLGLVYEREIAELVCSSVRLLPKQYRMVQFYRYWCDMTWAQVGSRVGVSGARCQQIHNKVLWTYRVKCWRAWVRGGGFVPFREALASDPANQ
jgi:hypothetical protein